MTDLTMKIPDFVCHNGQVATPVDLLMLFLSAVGTLWIIFSIYAYVRTGK